MSNESLLRDLAPVTPAAWSAIEDEARATLKATLAARKLVDFNGPLGWEASSLGLGRTETLDAGPAASVQAHLRRVQPLVELRLPFEILRAELEALDRGAADADLDPVREAARAMALAEDRAVFHGYAAADIQGIGEAAADSRATISDDYTVYHVAVAEALHRLRSQGVAGPYALALGPRCFTGLSKTLVGGYPALRQVQRLVEGPVIPAPAIDGAVLVSTRGGDFELTVGQDFSVGYLNHTDTSVTLYLQESLTFRVLAPEAAVPLVYHQG